MRMEDEKEIEAFSESFNRIFKFLIVMKRDKDVVGEKCIRDVDGELGVNDVDRKMETAYGE